MERECILLLILTLSFARLFDVNTKNIEVSLYHLNSKSYLLLLTLFLRISLNCEIFLSTKIIFHHWRTKSVKRALFVSKYDHFCHKIKSSHFWSPCRRHNCIYCSDFCHLTNRTSPTNFDIDKRKVYFSHFFLFINESQSVVEVVSDTDEGFFTSFPVVGLTIKRIAAVCTSNYYIYYTNLLSSPDNFTMTVTIGDLSIYLFIYIFRNYRTQCITSNGNTNTRTNFDIS